MSSVLRRRGRVLAAGRKRRWKEERGGGEAEKRWPVAGAGEGPALKSLVPYVQRFEAPITNGHDDAGSSLLPSKERQQAPPSAAHWLADLRDHLAHQGLSFTHLRVGIQAAIYLFNVLGEPSTGKVSSHLSLCAPAVGVGGDA